MALLIIRAAFTSRRFQWVNERSDSYHKRIASECRLRQLPVMKSRSVWIGAIAASAMLIGGDEEIHTSAKRAAGDNMTDSPAINSIPTKILVPIDFSASSRTALEMAADLAAHFHAGLVLLHVIPMFTSSTLPDFVPETKFLEETREKAEGMFDAVREELSGKGVGVSTFVEEGNDVAGNIMEVVDRERIDFLVISTHGLTGWRPAVFGSIAEKVMRMVECPLLLLRSPRQETDDKAAVSTPHRWW